MEHSKTDRREPNITRRVDPRVQHTECEHNVIPKFVSLHQHLVLLTRFVGNYLPHPEDVGQEQWDKYAGQEHWTDVQNTLFLAATINEIVPHSQVLQEDAGWCRLADEYDSAKEELVAYYVREATRFIWSWISFEHVVDKLCPGLSKHRTDNAANYIETSNSRVLDGGTALIRILDNICKPSVKEKAYRAATKSNNPKYLHIHYCREMRNFVAHEPVRNIEPLDWGDDAAHRAENDDRVVQLRVASRLALLAIQEILIAYLHQSPAKTDENEDGEEFDSLGIRSEVNLWKALRVIHLRELCETVA